MCMEEGAVVCGVNMRVDQVVYSCWCGVQELPFLSHMLHCKQ